ncbi:hypothetical protein W97_09330 [Coniosporium apollinis CBS 100218]|uniref:Uncharacterized protein n=1 Tax=Coniosporium apollinis (strain CBS 100218) TaxID=1168221 RepID=R7Z7R2_CONA1|nr:uncharacterized protein W97_09330 [Coniosporium apollinis CBS 100218]EON70064.1 hypothetical protein W97_09330 [Coniosporium apollinis CBS 100218]
MALLLAPYNDSMRLGMGFNSYTQIMCIDQAVEITAGNTVTARAENPSQVVSYSSRFVEKLSDVVNSMNISYGSSIKRGTVEISGNASSVDEDKIKASDLNAIVAVKVVVNQTTTLTDSCRFKPIERMLPDSPRFNEVYGDCYISGFIEGGQFTGIMSIRILDRSKVEKTSASIKNAVSTGSKGDFTLNSFNVAADGSGSGALKDTETTISVSWMGGGQVKDPKKSWDMDSMFTAAAAFPAQVAKCPQRTWAVLIKYKANRSFVEWSENKKFTPLEYENISSFTGELFENFMEYKLLLKKVQDMLQNRDSYEVQPDRHNAITTDVPTLIAVRSAMHNEMNKIVEAVDVLAKDPGILKRQKSNYELPTNTLVRSILLEARHGRFSSAHPPEDDKTKTAPAGNAGKSNDSSSEADGNLERPIASPQSRSPGASGPDQTVPFTAGFPPPPEADKKPETEGKSDKAPVAVANPEPVKLKIHAASWGGADVTSHMDRLISDDHQTLTLDTNVCLGYAEHSGVQKITPTAASEKANIKRVGTAPRRAGSNLYLIAVLYGDKVIALPTVYKKIHKAAESKQPFPVSNAFFKGDP